MNKVTKRQREFMGKIAAKNCDSFRILRTRPEFIKEVGRIQKKWELPISVDSSCSPYLRVLLAFVAFRYGKLIEEVIDFCLADYPKADRGNIYDLLDVVYEDEFVDMFSEIGKKPQDFFLPPIGGWSDMPSSETYRSFLYMLFENFEPILKAVRGEQPLPEQVAKAPERLGFSSYDHEHWELLSKGQPPLKKIALKRNKVRKIKSIKATKEEYAVAIVVYPGSSLVFVSFLEDIRILMKKFGLGPEWLSTMLTYIVTDVDPITIRLIPHVNVGVSRHSEGHLSFDSGPLTTTRDLECLRALMRPPGPKKSHHNYPRRNLLENLQIVELSTRKKSVREAIQKKRKEAKPKTPDDDKYMLDIEGPAADVGIGEKIFPNRTEATDKQLADSVRKRRYRLKEFMKKMFGLASSSNHPVKD